MNPTIQPGMHPDAEVLSAFAEQLLSDTERKDVVAHMATCGRCREVVFLAQKAMEAEEPVQPLAEVPVPKPGGSWFAGWSRWSWIPVAALAGVVGFAVIRHVDRVPGGETRMAKSLAPPEVVQSRPVTRSPATTPPEPKRPRPSREESSQKAAAPERADRDAALDRRSTDEEDKVIAEKKDEAPREADSLNAAMQDSSRSVHGALGARAKSSSVGGPMAQNQVQQQSNAQSQQNYANEDRQGSVLSNKPVSSPVRSGGASETVSVEAAGGPLPVSPAPAAPQSLIAQAESESAVVSGKNLSKRKAGTPALPSKLAAISEATSGKRTIAIDTAGSLFLSEDAGKHWQTVDAKWSGRAVWVKTGPTVGAVGGLLKQSIARFELTTDKQETWTSDDGKAWTLEAPAAQ